MRSARASPAERRSDRRSRVAARPHRGDDPAREWAAIARVLREEHLLRGVPWSELAVVVRSGAQRARYRARARARRGADAHRPAAASRCGTTRPPARCSPSSMSASGARDAHRRARGRAAHRPVRRSRPARRCAGCASRCAPKSSRAAATAPSGELLVEALPQPGRLATIDHRVGRAPTGSPRPSRRCATSDGDRSRSCSGSRGIAAASRRPWREQALGSGVTAAEANRNLDGVVALFTRRQAIRRAPARPTRRPVPRPRCSTPRSQKTCSRRSRTDDAVLVTTPSGVVGLEFDTVVVAALQDGRLAEPAAARLAARAAGARAALAATAATRRPSTSASSCSTTSCGCSRSRSPGRRERVVLAAVANDDESPSPFFALLPRRHPVPLDRLGDHAAAVAARRHRAGCAAARRSAVARASAEAAARVAGRARAPGPARRAPRPTGTGSCRSRRPGRCSTSDDGPGLAVAHRDASRSRRSTGSSRRSRAATRASSRGRRHDPALGDGDRRPTRGRRLWQRGRVALGRAAVRGALARRAAARTRPRVHRGARRVPRRLRARGRSWSGPRGGSSSEASCRRAVDAESTDRQATAPRVQVRGSIDRIERSRRRRGRDRRPQDRPPDHAQRARSTSIRSSARTSSPTREGKFDEALDAAPATTASGGAKLLYVKEGTGGKRYREGVQAAARRRAARGVPRHASGRPRSCIAAASSRARSSSSSSAVRHRPRGCGCTGCGRCPVTERRSRSRAPSDCRPPTDAADRGHRGPARARPRGRRRRQRQDRDDGQPRALAARERARAAERVLGLTFTRKAAGELRGPHPERIEQLAAAGLVPPDDYDPFEPPTVATYNSFANTIFRDNAILLGRESDGAVLGEAAAWQLARSVVDRDRATTACPTSTRTSTRSTERRAAA